MDDRLPNMHDAVLERIELRWSHDAPDVTFHVSQFGSGQPIQVVARSATHFSATRLNEWGPSESVNSASVESDAERQFLTIEMQSGDQIAVHCASITAHTA